MISVHKLLSGIVYISIIKVPKPVAQRQFTFSCSF